MGIENTLERIAAALEELATKVVAPAAAPAKRTRKKKETTPVEVKETAFDDGLPPVDDTTVSTPADITAPTTSTSATIDDVRAAAAPLVKVSGAGSREGYEAAQAIIVKYAASIADVPAADRAAVIAELNAVYENWGL